MESYRIARWTELPHGVSSLQARRAMAAMSVGWVSRAWLERRANLSPQNVDSLLNALDAQGALLRSDRILVPDLPARGVGAMARRFARSTMNRIRHATVSWYASGTGGIHVGAEPSGSCDGIEEALCEPGWPPVRRE